jgi:hypothetical protein
MKVKFYPNDIESDVIEVPDDITEDELNDMACDWVVDNVCGFWKEVKPWETE